MIKRNRWLWFVIFTLAAIVLLTLFFAPRSSPLMRGSTYSRAPNGYGAWFAYMQQQNLAIERWQRSPDDLLKETQPLTLLRVNPEMGFVTLSEAEEKWLRRGNTIVELGLWSPVSRAAFTTMQTSPQGNVKIETARRQPSINPTERRLGDQFVAIVWRQAIGQGQIIR
ncbi:MAG: DUF4350 domain-containing protein, partial [Microcoleus sp. SIO2G3]|nr:DUF4350 domain-containing protein [Microcoleus sp. SIO2G3]